MAWDAKEYATEFLRLVSRAGIPLCVEKYTANIKGAEYAHRNKLLSY